MAKQQVLENDCIELTKTETVELKKIINSNENNQELEERNKNDKRYEEPFENDGAYADDDND
jgi:hypothetical protein